MKTLLTIAASLLFVLAFVLSFGLAGLLMALVMGAGLALVVDMAACGDAQSALYTDSRIESNCRQLAVAYASAYPFAVRTSNGRYA